VPVASLDLNNPVIRERMLSAEFPRRDPLPEVRWSCRSSRATRRGRFAARGELTIHGHTQTVEATGRIGLPGPGLLSPENRVGIELSATVDRRDFGLDWQEALRAAATPSAGTSRSRPCSSSSSRSSSAASGLAGEQRRRDEREQRTSI